MRGVGKGKVLVSSCLLGEKVRYDGRDAKVQHPFLVELERQGLLVRFCPEVAGGLPTPRPEAEIVGGSGRDVLRGKARVRDRNGNDLTAAFLKGAREAVEAAQRAGVVVAVLKDRSPSCAPRNIYDGTFSGVKNTGFGVTAAMLGTAGIAVFPETELGAAEVFWRMGIGLQPD